MTFDEFINKWNGKTIDYDGHFGYQCMDLYRQYVQDVLQCPQSVPVDGAAAVWDTYLPQYFERVTNAPNNVPQKGDIVIWNRKVGGGFGHIAVFHHGTVMSFTSFDQNWGGVACHLQGHDYSNVLGWLRFKGTVVPDYKRLYEEQLARANDLQSKIDKAKEALR